jgi:hypothetical protein
MQSKIHSYLELIRCLKAEQYWCLFENYYGGNKTKYLSDCQEVIDSFPKEKIEEMKRKHRITQRKEMKMEQIKTIEELSIKLQNNNTWIRKAWESLMSEVSKIKTDEEISAYTITEEDECGDDNYVVLGADDLMIETGGFPSLVTRETENSYRRSWDCFSISELKHCLEKFPSILEELKARMIRSNEDTEKLKIMYSHLIKDEK